MTEIEKLFENANAYKMLCKCSYKNLFDYSIDYGQDVCIHVEDEIRKGCEGCELAKQNVKYYPPFTPEKQLELIKWLAKIYDELSINWEEHYCSYRFVIRNYINGRLSRSICNYKGLFEETLAYLISGIWQDLTDQEKEEIRNILNA